MLWNKKEGYSKYIELIDNKLQYMSQKEVTVYSIVRRQQFL